MEADIPYQFVLNAMGEWGIYLTDPSGRLSFWSEGAEHLLGYPDHAVLGGGDARFHASIEQAEDLARARASGEPRVYRTEAKLLHQDGSSLVVTLTAHPVLDPQGQLLGYCHVLFPGKANEATNERRFADEQFRILVQGVVDYAIYLLDLDGHVQTWNLGANRIKGYAAEEIIGKSFSLFYTEQDRQAGEPGRGLAQALAHGRFENRAWRTRKDGSLFWAHVVIDRIDDDQGRAIGFAKVTHDETELLRSQEAMEKMRTALHQAQKMEAVGHLTGGIAHDFNNILQVIAGNLHLLLDEVAGNERAHLYAANAMSGVERGSRLASQLLSFGRRQLLAPRVLNPGRLVRGMDDLLRRTLGDGIEVETIIGGGLWNTLIDPTNLESAILNLAINARDAMEGHGKLTVEAGNAYLDDGYARLHNEVEPGQYVLIAVTDTGCGMAPGTVEKVFEPFFSTKPEGSGTGLGLSMVYGFVKQSGGHVKIYSEIGHGTTVKLYLPRNTKPEHQTMLESSGPVSGGSESILVVEDDQAVREIAVAQLRQLGYTVYQASDARAAQSVIESGIALDLLFTDVVMPGELRSPELAKLARERLPNLAVLFTSGYTENAIVHGGRLDDGVHLLGKPYTREALARKVRQVIAEAHTKHRETPPRALRLLVCEDEEDIRSVVKDLLERKGYGVVAASSAEEAIRLCDEGEHVDLLIADVSLPFGSGVDLANALREREPNLPVIFATGRAEESDIPVAARTLTILKPYGADTLFEAISSLTDSITSRR